MKKLLTAEERRQHVLEAAQAHTNLTTFEAVVSVLEGGCVYGDNAAARKIIKICKAEQQRQLKLHVLHVAAASVT